MVKSSGKSNLKEKGLTPATGQVRPPWQGAQGGGASSHPNHSQEAESNACCCPTPFFIYIMDPARTWCRPQWVGLPTPSPYRHFRGPSYQLTLTIPNPWGFGLPATLCLSLDCDFSKRAGSSGAGLCVQIVAPVSCFSSDRLLLGAVLNSG